MIRKENDKSGNTLQKHRKSFLSKKRNSHLSDEVVEFILTLDINEFETINVSSIARQFNVNRCYLSQKFKNDKKLSLSDYIVMIKILRATNILANKQDITIESLAKIMGYSNSDYFSRIFRERMGTTPGKYKTYIKRFKIMNIDARNDIKKG